MTLRRCNNVLSVIIIILAFYIFFLPVLPEVGWWWWHSAPLVSKPVHTALAPHHSPASVPKDNRLIIPAMDLNAAIVQGTSPRVLDTGGAWLRPNGSTPDHGGNTVMAGHRLTYTNPRGVFYFLDKVQVGDPIEVDWHGVAYIYKTTTIEIVPPQDTAVEAATTNAQLTLYTCTPLWNFQQRLVVIAQKVSQT